MSHGKTLSKYPLFVAAIAVTAAGFFTVAPPVQAEPGCTQWGFNGPVELAGGNGWWVKFNSTGQTATGSANVNFVDGGRVDGTIIGGGIQGDVMDLNIVWGDKPNNIWDFHGTVGDDGRVNDGGQRLRTIPSDYSGEVASSWALITPLKCMDAPAQSGTGTDTGPVAAPAAPPPPVKCPKGSPADEVPAGQTCPAPKDAIGVTFTRASFQWTVIVTNSADLDGSCTYNATADNGTAGASNNFDIGAKGTANFKVPAPAPFTTYHVVTSCTGTYDGQPVEFGHDEQDVSL